MNNKETIEVYTLKRDLTIYRDTYLRCELINKEDEGQSRLKIISVHTGKGGLLPDLTDERVDEVILVDNADVYYNLYEMQKAIANQL